jgi:hypothetical protein
VLKQPDGGDSTITLERMVRGSSRMRKPHEMRLASVTGDLVPTPRTRHGESRRRDFAAA